MSEMKMYRKRRVALAVSLALSAMHMAGAAETASGAGEAVDLGAVVVTATHREEALQKVATQVTAISGEEIDGESLRSTKDVARYVPATQGWNTESRARPRFFIRGVGSNEATNNAVNPIAYYADQVYYGNTLFAGAPLFDLERVEVLRGPQGTLWGKNTTGGAFHFISKAPKFSADGYSKVELGSHDSRVLETAYGGPIIEDRVAGRAAVHYEKRGGVAQNTVTGNEVGDYEDFAGRFQARAILSPDLDVLLNTHVRKLNATQNPWYSVTRNGAADRFGYTAPIGDGSGDLTHVAYNLDLPIKLDTEGLSATVHKDFGELSLTSITAYDQGLRTGIVDSDYTPVEWPSGSGRSYSRNRVAQFSQEFRLASPKEDRFNWLAGLYHFRDRNKSFGASASLTGNTATQQYSYTEYRQDTSSTALFGNARYALTERFKLNGGVRLTRETVGIDLLTRKAAASSSAYVVSGDWWQPVSINSPLVTYFSTNGRIANTWSNLGYDLTPEYQLAANQLVFFKHASGFRSGNYNTYINTNSALASVSQFAVVKPEKLKSYELGYKSNWFANRLTLNGGVYHYDYRDMQLVVNQVYSGVFYPTLANAGKGTVNGVEFETAWQATPALRLRSNLSYLKTRFKELTANGKSYAGYNFARVPQLTALFGGDYKFRLAEASLLLGTDWSYTSKHNFNVTDNTDPYALQDSYWIGNLQAAYSFRGDRVILGAYVKNVTNKRYKVQAMLYQGGLTDGTGGHYPTAYGELRTFGVSLTYKY